MDNLIRLWRQIKPMFYSINNERGEVDGGDPPAGDPPAGDPPAGDPPPTDPPANEFFSSLSEENRIKNDKGVATLEKFKSADELAKGYRELETVVGKKGIIIPDADAPPEAHEKFYNDLGRPENPDGYKLTPVEGLDESIKVTPESQTAFNAIMHKIGATNSQADQLNTWYLGAVNQITKQEKEAQKEAMAKAETELRAEWKENYDANRDKVAGMLQKVGGDELIDSLGGIEGFGNNPLFLKAMGKIANAMSEDQIGNFHPDNAPTHGNESVDQAKQKLAEYAEQMQSGDKKHPINDENNKDHKAAVQDRMRLYRIAYPEGPAT